MYDLSRKARPEFKSSLMPEPTHLMAIQGLRNSDTVLPLPPPPHTYSQEVVDELEMHALHNLWLQLALAMKGWGSSSPSSDSARTSEIWVFLINSVLEIFF